MPVHPGGSVERTSSGVSAPRFGVEAKRGHRGIELIGDEHQRQRWVEVDVPRTRAGAHDRVAALDVAESFGVGVETVDEHAVDPEVRDEREAVGGIGKDAVRVWRVLTFGVRSGARVLHDLRRRRECSIRLDRQHRDIAADVVGDEHDATAAVHAHVTRRATSGWLLVTDVSSAPVSVATAKALTAPVGFPL